MDRQVTLFFYSKTERYWHYKLSKAQIVCTGIRDNSLVCKRTLIIYHDSNNTFIICDDYISCQKQEEFIQDFAI